MNAYALATIVFIGGSLVPQGGHNIFEPAALGKPVIFGPYVESFQEIVERLLSASAAIQVKNSEELKLQILNLLGSPALREKIGINALQA
ncbi:MAG TPA: 3-deoxy-D-manno-octulosonic acid transferase, partial [Elusimicrobia bacterium]|nr:3-deoxy-D-manno-octulosonic acid transferase [Elusimicrobiota bacterium]